MLLNECYHNTLTLTDVPHYRRTVMTSFPGAGDHNPLQPRFSLILSGFSMKSVTFQRHRKHWYQTQTNLKREKHTFVQIVHLKKFKMWPMSHTILLKQLKHFPAFSGV